jgi:hypothetical protein
MPREDFVWSDPAMTQLTLTIPDELAARLRTLEDQLPEILELGLLQWTARHEGTFAGLADVLETLAALPSPQEVLDLRPAPELRERVEQLLDKNRSGGLLPEEEREWQQYEFVEHLVRVAKARAALKVKQAGSNDESNVHPG